ncbi:hypothetical protein LV779_04560 [Streptomyces thinghirensis]|nr:hypothetical protein [Streptomyces thinghirensis]
MTLSNNRAVTIYLWHNLLILATVPIIDLAYQLPFMQSERAVAALDGAYTIWMFALIWPLNGLMVLAVGWVEDLAAKRKRALWPNGANALRREPAQDAGVHRVDAGRPRDTVPPRPVRDCLGCGSEQGGREPVRGTGGMSKRQTQRCAAADGERGAGRAHQSDGVREEASRSSPSSPSSSGTSTPTCGRAAGATILSGCCWSPTPARQARNRAAQNWAQYPNAGDGVPVPPLVPDAFELLKAPDQPRLTGKSAEKRMGYGASASRSAAWSSPTASAVRQG